jgi:hypothetical protein
MVAFLAILNQLFSLENPHKITKKEFIGLFIPFFFLFLSYRGGFFAYISIIIIASISIKFIYKINKNTFNRIGCSIWSGASLILSLTALSFLLAPVAAFMLIIRTIEVAQTKAGWTLPFLNPWTISGLPVYEPSFFSHLHGPPNLPVIYWFIFLAIVIFLSVYVSRKELVRDNSGKWPNLVFSSGSMKFSNGYQTIWPAVATYFASVIVYLAAFKIIGNQYQVWKFVAYTALPLSFVPLALLVKTLIFQWQLKKRYRVFCVILLSLILVGSKLSIFFPLTQFPKKMFLGVISADSYLDTFYKIIHGSTKNTTFMLYLDENRMLEYLAVEYLKKQNRHRVKFLKHNPFFNLDVDYTSLLFNNNIIILSLYSFNSLFNNELRLENSTKINIIDNNWLKNHGFISYFGFNNLNTWEATQGFFKAKVVLPEKLKNKDIQLNVSLSSLPNQQWNCGSTVRLILYHEGDTIVSTHQIKNIEQIIPSSLINNLFFQFSIFFNDKCSFTLSKVDISPN